LAGRALTEVTPGAHDGDVFLAAIVLLTEDLDLTGLDCVDEVAGVPLAEEDLPGGEGYLVGLPFGVRQVRGQLHDEALAVRRTSVGRMASGSDV